MIELVVAFLIALLVILNSPQIGMLFSFVGVLVLVGTPIIALVAFLIPSLRHRIFTR